MHATSSTYTSPETPTCEVPSNGVVEISLHCKNRRLSATPRCQILQLLGHLGAKVTPWHYGDTNLGAEFTLRCYEDTSVCFHHMIINVPHVLHLIFPINNIAAWKN